MQLPKNGSLQVDGINVAWRQTFSYLLIPSDFLANIFPHTIEILWRGEVRFWIITNNLVGSWKHSWRNWRTGGFALIKCDLWESIIKRIRRKLREELSKGVIEWLKKGNIIIGDNRSKNARKINYTCMYIIRYSMWEEYKKLALFASP